MNDNEPCGPDINDDPELVVPSTKLRHDFVPQVDSQEMKVLSARGQPQLYPCPQCGTRLESWQMSCHSCGQRFDDRQPPPAVQEPSSSEQIFSSFSDWLNKGKQAYAAQEFGEAQSCLNEALLRTKGLKNSRELEVEVRKTLAKALQKQDKRAEAAQQYLALAKLLGPQNSKYEERARQLAESSVDLMAQVGTEASFRRPTGKERKLVPLYCGSCKQLLAQAEVYGFRIGKTTTVRCFCGKEGEPLVRCDEKHLRALKAEPELRKEKAQLLDAACNSVAGKRRREKAIAAALLFGFVGGQRFYLGDYFYGAFYALWFAAAWLLVFIHTGSGFDKGACALSFLPWLAALIEAASLARMSRMNFNLRYNIEELVSRLPEERQLEPTATAVFSMEAGEEPGDPDDGFEDDLTASSVKLKVVRRADALHPDPSDPHPPN